jgi:hypothetical protein
MIGSARTLADIRKRNEFYGIQPLERLRAERVRMAIVN